MAVTDLMHALLGVGVDVAHYTEAQNIAPPYIVWGETGFTPQENADDHAQTLLVSGELWYYTSDEFDKTVHDILDAFESVGAAWSAPSIGWDNQKKLIVYGFRWSLPCGYGEVY